MAATTILDRTAITAPVPSYALDVSWILAMRNAMNHEELERALSPFGIYCQRKRGRFLLRVKVPCGELDLARARGLADLVAAVPDAVIHLTTRGNVELQGLTAEDLPPTLDRVAALGLSSRESGGSTVRSITTCSLAGICPHEVFDVRPYAAQLSRRFRGLGVTSVLPRKFKIALSGCAHDCAFSGIHDVGAVATLAQIGGEASPGFRVLVGGGLGAAPKLAALLSEAVPASSLEPIASAVLDIFQQDGDYEHRNRARLKFVLEKAGIADIRRRVFERANVGDCGAAPDGSWRPLGDQPPFAPIDRPVAGEFTLSHRQWLRANVIAQRQPDRSAVFVPLLAGDLNAGQMRALADLCAAIGVGAFRLTLAQEVLIPDVPSHHLDLLYRSLSALGLDECGGRTSVIACPGTTGCSRSITASPGLALALRSTLPAGWAAEAAFAGTRIDISGCPNSCAQAQIGAIGLAGCAAHAGGRVYPAYRLYIGGGTLDGDTRLGRFIARMPARHVPQAIARLWQLYAEVGQGETFVRFARHVDEATVKAALSSLLLPPAVSEGDGFVDWGEALPFAVHGRGEAG